LFSVRESGRWRCYSRCVHSGFVCQRLISAEDRGPGVRAEQYGEIRRSDVMDLCRLSGDRASLLLRVAGAAYVLFGR